MTSPIVEVDDVRKHFGEVHALNGVSLGIAAGEVYGLLGANGAGKTTLINVLATLIKPDGGSARIAGTDVVTDPTAARKTIGLAGQFAAVDDYQTGRENVVMVGRLYGLSTAQAKRRADDVLGRFNLLDAADRQAKGYSGGMRRRLDLAASLVGRPRVLFLDEPTTGIDPASRLDIWDLVRDLVAEGTTVLLTTQYLEEADELADRIGVIDHGLLVTEGTADELKDEMGANSIHLAVREEDMAAAVQATADIAGVVHESSTSLVIPAVDGNRTMLAILRKLDAVGVEPVNLSLERPTLDDVFLRITGGGASASGTVRGSEVSA